MATQDRATVVLENEEGLSTVEYVVLLVLVVVLAVGAWQELSDHLVGHLGEANDKLETLDQTPGGAGG